MVCEAGHGPSVGKAAADPDRCTLASLQQGANTVTHIWRKRSKRGGEERRGAHEKAR